MLRPKSVESLTGDLLPFADYLTTAHPEVTHLEDLDRSHIEGFLVWNRTRTWRGQRPAAGAGSGGVDRYTARATSSAPTCRWRAELVRLFRADPMISLSGESGQGPRTDAAGDPALALEPPRESFVPTDCARGLSVSPGERCGESEWFPGSADCFDVVL